MSKARRNKSEDSETKAKRRGESMFFKDSYDVIVVGAGPAGCVVAKELASFGFDVLLLDRAQEIGVPKETGEGISEGAIKRLGLKVPDYCIAWRVNCSRVYAPNGSYVELKGNGVILEMKRFVKWLACEAALAGARVCCKCFVHDVLKDERGFVSGVKFRWMGEEKEAKAKLVIAADGVESLVAKKAGLNTTCSPYLVDAGVQYEMANIDIEEPRRIEIYLGNQIAPRGYVWIFPKGEKIANVGVGIAGNRVEVAKRYLDSFIKTREWLRKGSVIEVNAGCIPVGGFMKDMVLDGLIVVGDAAHQVNPLHGGGIAEAMHAAKIAANVAKKALEKGDVSKNVLKEYNELWWKERGTYLKKAEKARELLEKLSDDDLNKLASVITGEDIYKITHGDVATLIKLLLKFGIKKLKG